MLISDLIAELEKIKYEYGDLQVGLLHPEFGGYDPVTRITVRDNNSEELEGRFDCDDPTLGDKFVGLKM